MQTTYMMMTVAFGVGTGSGSPSETGNVPFSRPIGVLTRIRIGKTVVSLSSEVVHDALGYQSFMSVDLR